MKAKGLIAAGGEATRLGELTRVVNKHLLPVGAWPMIFYPLQLLQLAGVREVMIVTGQGHAGQLIDLLGNGRLDNVERRLSLRPRSTQGAGRSRRDRTGRRHGRELRRRRRPDRLPRRQHLQYAEAAAIRSFVEGDDGAAVFVKEVPDPERFGVVVYGEDGRVVDVVEKAGVVDLRYPSPPSNDAVVGLYAYSPDVFDVIRGLEPSSRGELEIRTSTATTPSRARWRAIGPRLVGGRGHAGVAARDRRLIGRTGVNKVEP
jgi:glucose-1-phosphate thymidylyltransferase